MGLPEVELGTSWGDNPTYKVRGKGFLMHRPPGRTAIDPETGEWYDDLLVIQVPSESEKRALVERRAAAVLHDRPLQRLQRRAGPADAGSARSAAPSWPRSSPTRG